MYQGKFSNQPSEQKVQKDRRASGPAPQQMPRRQQPETQEAPRYAPEAPQYAPEDFRQPDQMPVKQVIKRRRFPRISGILFYLLLIGAILAVYHQAGERAGTLKQELEIYEKTQPQYICESLFSQIFAEPDWAVIYDNAGVEDTQFEGKDAFVSYMEEKIGQTPLTYEQMGGGEALTYGVFLGNEQIASFSMENRGSEIQPDWQLAGLEVRFTPQQSYRIRSMDGHTVKVNGVELDDSYVIQRDSMRAAGEEGENLKFPGVCIREITDLLVMPTVTITDEKGQALEVTYDEGTRTFSEPEQEGAVIGEEEKELALEAVRTYCEYMIKKAPSSKLGKYFKPGSDTYKYITGSDLTWIQRERDHGFADEKVTDYIRYNEDMFSARVSLTWQLTRQDGTIKESSVEESLVFERNSAGKWICTRMTGLDLAEPVRTVRVRFLQDGSVLSSQMLESTVGELTCPEVNAPEGKQFAGWAVRCQAEDSSLYDQRILMPDEQGNARVPGKLLEKPVDFYPVFEVI